MERRYRAAAGTLTGLGILGTFVGLLLGLRGISFVTVEAALGSVQSILAGINTAFYTSIAACPVDPLQHHKQCPAHYHES